jgi:DNA modification methylase
MPEYLLVFRKWAKDGEEHLIRPVTHPKTKVPLECWQELASQLWPDTYSYGWNYSRFQSGKGDRDLRSTDVLNVACARDEKAERHLCPMPLNITHRALQLWSNDGDVCFSPFGGVGSEGVASLRIGRKFIGVELNPSYYAQAIKNLKAEESSGIQMSIFDVLGLAENE